MCRTRSGYRRIRFVVAVFGAALLMCAALPGSPRAAASSIAACEQWKSKAPTEVERVSSWLKSLIVGFFELRRDTAAAAGSQATGGEIYFTNTSNYSQQPLCYDDKPPSRVNHLYYPVGVVVRRLGEVDLRGKYWLVETEYGMKTYIREEHLTLLRQDRVYFFANTAVAQKRYCLKQSEEPCGPGDYAANRRIDPQRSYAAADAAQFERRGYGGRNYIIEDITLLPCGLIHVGLYVSGGPASDSAPAERGRMTTCTDPSIPVATDGKPLDNPQPVFDPAIKAVRLTDYEAYFAKRVEGHLLRVDRSLLGKFAPEFGVQKPCNATLTFDSETTYSLSGGANIKYLAGIELGGKAAKSYLHKFKREYASGVAITLHAYDLMTETEGAGAAAAPIQITYGCEATATAPQSAQEIRVSHPTLGDSGDFIIGIKNADDDADKTGVLTVVSRDKSELFNEGFVFSIDGPQDYFAVRDKVFGLLLGQSYNKIQQFYDDPDDQLYLWRATSFLTHLIIATAGKPGYKPGR